MKYKSTHNRTAFQIQVTEEIKNLPEFKEFYSSDYLLKDIEYKGPISIVWIDNLEAYHIWRVGQNKILGKRTRQPLKKRCK